MITRQQIVDDLALLVLRIANELPAPSAEDSYDRQTARAAEWAYVKGIASHAVLQLRDRLSNVQDEWSSPS